MKPNSAAPAPAPASTATAEEPLPMHLQRVVVPVDLRLHAIQSPAINAMCRLRGGDFVAELEDALHRLTGSCMTLGSKGEITIKIGIKPDGHKRIAISDSITVKEPKAKAGTTAMFATPDGQMLTQDPDQREFGFNPKVVQIDEQEARRVL